MKTRLVIRPEATRDLREAYSWYESQSPGIGRAMLQRVREQLRIIRERPEVFPIVLRSVRRAPLKRFPYGIYYNFQGDRIVVLAVYHFKRSPDGWMSRM